MAKVIHEFEESIRNKTCIVLKNIMCLYELLTGNIKIKAILPPVFGVHWLNRISLFLWALILSKVSSNACRLLILSNVCWPLILSYESLLSKKIFECNISHTFIDKIILFCVILYAELRSERSKKNKKHKIRNQERASNIKIKAILPLVFGVHWLNRISLLLWAYCISLISNVCGSQILSNACRSLILSNTCGSLILSKINFE